MRAISLGLAVLLATTTAMPAMAAAETKIVADANAPKGKLPDAAAPSAYRLDFTILPEADRFSGHDEIDINVKAPARSLYLHGRDLDVTKAVAMVGGKAIPATWTQVDDTGTARLDFASELPAGAATLKFDYSGAFNDSASGLFHVKVDDKWYSWTQFESIDARAAYPGFDEPGFKTPFTVSVTTHPDMVVVGNAPEVSVTKTAGGMEKHQLARNQAAADLSGRLRHRPVRPRGRDDPAECRALGADALRRSRDPAAKGKDGLCDGRNAAHRLAARTIFRPALPLPQARPDRLSDHARRDGECRRRHLRRQHHLPRPRGDLGDKQAFGMVVAHELSHQWFGDLVTPAWWDDIWLNESFANWMGYRIGNEWRPELNIGVGALDEGFGAMNTDALEVGRPIHQPITDE